LEIIATFDEVGGLKARAQVVVGGVKVGQVQRIALDEYLRARVVLDIDASVELPTDTSASILTAGMLGDQYIALEPGGDEELMRSGDEIIYTQSAVIIERLIGKAMNKLGGEKD
jgi:phospholipid/cholesterol/gamma-HCH transport system substrate-binding protein